VSASGADLVIGVVRGTPDADELAAMIIALRPKLAGLRGAERHSGPARTLPVGRPAFHPVAAWSAGARTWS
jgi:hypothetical protein